MNTDAAKIFRLAVGEVVIGLACDSVDYADSLRDYFGRAPVEAEPHLLLDLQVLPHDDRPDIPTSLFTSKVIDGDRFDIANGLITGRLDPDRRRGELAVKAILMKGLRTRVFEQILYQAFHTAQKTAGRDGLLVHSAGVVADGGGYLFVGASGAGKSTIATLSSDQKVLNDEINLVDYTDDGVRLVGSPFNGHFTAKVEGEAPLAAIFLLRHGPQHRIEAVGRAEAVATVTAQVVPPVGLTDPVPASIRMDMIDGATRLCAATPVERLVFAPDAGLWRPILDQRREDELR